MTALLSVFIKIASPRSTSTMRWFPVLCGTLLRTSHSLTEALVGRSNEFASKRVTLDDEDLLYEESVSIPSSVLPTKRKGAVADFEEHSLSAKQAAVLTLIKGGNNVFITGVAGTGKSLLLKRAIRYLKIKYRNPNQFVAVGPTGPTAMALEGQTIHSFAGLGIPRTPEDFRKTIKNKKRWKDLKVLILDEASMVSGEFFDRLSEVVSSIRGDWRPFGGIQLVVCGDFLQLPPIPPRPSDVQEMTAALQLEAGEDPNDLLFLNRGFLFQAKAWRHAEFQVVELEQVFRQKNTNFVAVLEEIRRGRLTPEGLSFLRTYCQRPLPPNDFGIRPTILHSMNKDVSRENLQELNQLKGETQVYGTIDTVEREKGAGQWVENVLLKNQFFTSCIAEKELQLKVGAQVMLVKNEGRGAGKNLVNGSRGKVVGFEAIKKSTHADDPLLPDVTLYPVVQFVTGGKKTIRPTLFQSRLVGLGTCTRLAIPLRLAWAITTHKSQGLTLDYVIADVGNVFAEAQAYVALSRASDENGLELRNFSASRVRANRMALAFYENPGQVFRYWDGSVPEPITGNQIQNDEDPSAPEPVRQLTGATPARQASFGSSIQGKTFVFSGTLTSMPRCQAEDLVQQRRGVVRGSVSGKTNFLVIGETMKNGKSSMLGADFTKAKAIVQGGKNVSNLQVLTEKQFFQWIKEKD